jgi:hypothetical protein
MDVVISFVDIDWIVDHPSLNVLIIHEKVLVSKAGNFNSNSYALYTWFCPKH